jgi:hypothetical protein
MTVTTMRGEAGLVEVQDTYLGLPSVPPDERRAWVLAREPGDAARWWNALLELAVSGGDSALAEFLVRLGLERGCPPDVAVRYFARLSPSAGGPSADDVARLALDQFGMSRDQAVALAAEPRDRPDHRLAAITGMLTELAPLVDRMTGIVAVVVRAWLDVLPELRLR